MEIVIYPNDAGHISIISPAPGVPINAAVSAVPSGKPHRIINSDDLPAATDWLWAAEGPILPAPPDLRTYTAAIEARIESVAVGRGYNDAGRLAGYTTSTVPKWAAEAQAFVAWRDAVWITAIAMLDAVEAGAAAPSVAEVLAALPAPSWP